MTETQLKRISMMSFHTIFIEMHCNYISSNRLNNHWVHQVVKFILIFDNCLLFHHFRSKNALKLHRAIKKHSPNATFHDSVCPGNWTHFPSIIECVLDQTNLINIFCFLPSTFMWDRERCSSTIEINNALEFNLNIDWNLIEFNRNYRLFVNSFQEHFGNCIW